MRSTRVVCHCNSIGQCNWNTFCSFVLRLVVLMLAFVCFCCCCRLNNIDIKSSNIFKLLHPQRSAPRIAHRKWTIKVFGSLVSKSNEILIVLWRANEKKKKKKKTAITNNTGSVKIMHSYNINGVRSLSHEQYVVDVVAVVVAAAFINSVEIFKIAYH